MEKQELEEIAAEIRAELEEYKVRQKQELAKIRAELEGRNVMQKKESTESVREGAKIVAEQGGRGGEKHKKELVESKQQVEPQLYGHNIQGGWGVCHGISMKSETPTTPKKIIHY